MAKRFKLKFSRVITSFNSCRSKDPSTLPSNPVPSFLSLSPGKLHLPPLLPLLPQQQPSKHFHSSIKRHMTSAFASISCGFRSRSTVQYLSETDHTKSPPPPEFYWKKEEKWHIVAKMYDETPRQKIYNSLVSANLNNGKILLPPPPPAPPNTERKRRQCKKKKKSTSGIRISTSSADSGLFSSEGLDDEQNDMDDEETETLVSSTRSFSTDYSSPDHLETIRETPFNKTTNNYHRQKKAKKAKRYVTRKPKKNCSESSLTSSSPARLSRFQWLIPCTVEGKVKESFAVVKKSEDPYEDFKRSMMEMIMEKQMFEVKDLEQMLQCFLSLNSRHHHGVIIEAFSEIWEALFCTNSITNGVNF